MTRAIVHLILHALVPGLVAWLAFRPRWRQVWLIMILTMSVDLDHLLAIPIYDPNRCGIGFHPLHSYVAIVGYAAMAAIPQLRIVGTGLLIHMALDGLDCMWISG